jgi:hypothetical protein
LETLKITSFLKKKSFLVFPFGKTLLVKKALDVDPIKSPILTFYGSNIAMRRPHSRAKVN